MRKIYLLLVAVLINTIGCAQIYDILGRDVNTITTAVPFLLMSPDPVGASLGETGVATSNDVYSLYWNPAKYGATSQLQSNDPSHDFRAAISYSPWLRRVVKDLWLGSFYCSKLISENSAISTSFRYFHMKDITYTDIFGIVLGTIKPYEWTVDIAYSQRISEHLYGGVALRYIYSDMTGGLIVSGFRSKPGTSLAADISAYYEKPLGENMLSFGASISNIGSKIAYLKGQTNKEFIPTILRIGPSFDYKINNHHQLRFSLEFDKLLVPSPPVYAIDSTGQVLFDENNEPVIAKGKSPNVSVFRGMIQSFYDAPEGFTEEIHEITAGIGVEYRLYNTVFFRTGYFSEHQTKGDRKLLSFGVGLKYKFVEAHLARSIAPEEGYAFADLFRKNNPYRRCWTRYSIAFDLAGIYKK